MRKKPIVSVTYEDERLSITKNSLPYIKCVLRLISPMWSMGRFWAVLWVVL